VVKANTKTVGYRPCAKNKTSRVCPNPNSQRRKTIAGRRGEWCQLDEHKRHARNPPIKREKILGNKGKPKRDPERQGKEKQTGQQHHSRAKIILGRWSKGGGKGGEGKKTSTFKTKTDKTGQKKKERGKPGM